MNTLAENAAVINNITNEISVSKKNKSNTLNNVDKKFLLTALSVIAMFVSGVALVLNMRGRLNVFSLVGYCLIVAGILVLITIIAVIIAERSEKNR